MCGTTKPLLREEGPLHDPLDATPFIVNDDPGDDSTYLDMPRDEAIFTGDLSDADVRELYEDNVAPGLTQYSRPSTAPNAGRIEALENREAMTRDALNHLSDVSMIQGSDIKALFERTDRIAGSLANLAVAVSDLRSQRTRGQRFAAWFAENVYSSRAR